MESLFDLNWPVPESFVPLNDGEAHIWCASIDQPLSVFFEMKACLSVDEQVKAARFRKEQARKQFILGRGLLRRLLGMYLEEHPAEVSFVYGDHGKPLLFYPLSGADLHFNLSHSGELVMLGFFKGGHIGVDVEQVRPVPEANVIAGRFFSPMESAALKIAGTDKRDLFFKIWTRKEALLKCTGEGLGKDDFTRPEAVIYELTPAPGYVAAVAVAAGHARVHSWRWAPEIFSSRTDLTPLL